MKKRRFFIVALVAMCGVAFYCARTSRSNVPSTSAVSAAAEEDQAEQADGEQAEQEESAAGQQPPAVVAVQNAVAITDLQPRQYAARLEPIDDVDIVPRVTGWIEKVNFKEGDVVKAGDLLFEIEDTTYQSALKTAEANCEQSAAVLKNAQANHKRAKDLYERNAGSQADYDNAVQALAQAEASVKISQAALVDAQTNLSYTKITSPIDGRIGKVTVTRGNLVTPQTGKIVDVKSFAPIHIRFAIGESVFNKTFGGRTKIRDLAQIKVCPVGSNREDPNAIKEYPEATIDLIDNKVDPSTNTVVIWATLPNEDERFFPGSYATILLSRKLLEPVCGVLLSAIMTESEGNYLYVLDENNVARRRFVKLGVISGKYQVVDSGIEIGDRVVVEGMNKLTDGAMTAPVDFDSLQSEMTAPDPTKEVSEDAENADVPENAEEAE